MYFLISCIFCLWKYFIFPLRHWINVPFFFALLFQIFLFQTEPKNIHSFLPFLTSERNIFNHNRKKFFTTENFSQNFHLSSQKLDEIKNCNFLNFSFCLFLKINEIFYTPKKTKCKFRFSFSQMQTSSSINKFLWSTRKKTTQKSRTKKVFKDRFFKQ